MNKKRRVTLSFGIPLFISLVLIVGFIPPQNSLLEIISEEMEWDDLS